MTGVAIVPVVVVPSRRWILRRTWDRLQLPQPFSRLTVAFAPPVDPQAETNEVRLRESVQTALAELERRWDPDEARRAGHAPRRRRAPRGDAVAPLQ
jgi:lysophospholipid acyltransferase (LPLAT)-like uncharacterized protein